MKPPPDLDRAGRAFWRAALADLEARNVEMTAPRFASLARYARCVAQAERIWVALDDDDLMIVGGNGQEALNPLLGAALMAERNAARHGEALGFGLAPRREGRPTGKASAPDRSETLLPSRLRKVG